VVLRVAGSNPVSHPKAPFRPRRTGLNHSSISIMNYWLFILPLIAAFLGWVIHSIAIHFFFSRLLPRKKEKLAKSIGRAAASEFVQFTGLEEKINDPKHLESILPVIEKHIDHFLNEKLKEEMPVISMFIGNKTTDKLKEVFMREIQSLFPQVIGAFARNLKSSLNIEEMVIKKINAISSAEFSQLIRNNLSSELKYLRLLGAIAGLIIGLVLFLITALISSY
jgi:uncharacterized membrane protein YheB (UPF0754 family)